MGKWDLFIDGFVPKQWATGIAGDMRGSYCPWCWWAIWFGGWLLLWCGGGGWDGWLLLLVGWWLGCGGCNLMRLLLMSLLGLRALLLEGWDVVVSGISSDLFVRSQWISLRGSSCNAARGYCLGSRWCCVSFSLMWWWLLFVHFSMSQLVRILMILVSMVITTIANQVVMLVGRGMEVDTKLFVVCLLLRFRFDDETDLMWGAMRRNKGARWRWWELYKSWDAGICVDWREKKNSRHTFQSSIQFFVWNKYPCIASRQ